MSQGYDVTITNPNGYGTVYYTLDGTDPRLSTALSSPGSMVKLVSESDPKRYIVPAGSMPSASTTQGAILRQWWLGITGDAVTDLTNSPDYPDNPTAEDEVNIFETPIDWAEDYGTRLVGYIHPPVSGDYTFWMAIDAKSDFLVRLSISRTINC